MGQVVYQSGSSIVCPILAVGDSWFWYPKGSNLLAEISQIVKPDYANIRAVGYIGAKLEDYVPGGKYADDFANELRPGWLQYYSAVMISGGGNDVVDWGLCLKDDCSGETSARGCMNFSAVGQHMGELKHWLGALISEVRGAYDSAGLRRPDIFTHTYDYAPPNGRGFDTLLLGIPLVPPWLKPAMDRCKVPADYELRKLVVHEFIDALAIAYAEFDSPPDRVHVVRSEGTLNADTDWDNELHPTAAGFRNLARGPWLAVLRDAGIANTPTQ